MRVDVQWMRCVLVLAGANVLSGWTLAPLPGPRACLRSGARLSTALPHSAGSGVATPEAVVEQVLGELSNPTAPRDPGAGLLELGFPGSPWDEEVRRRHGLRRGSHGLLLGAASWQVEPAATAALEDTCAVVSHVYPKHSPGARVQTQWRLKRHSPGQADLCWKVVDVNFVGACAERQSNQSMCAAEEVISHVLQGLQVGDMKAVAEHFIDSNTAEAHVRRFTSNRIDMFLVSAISWAVTAELSMSGDKVFMVKVVPLEQPNLRFRFLWTLRKSSGHSDSDHETSRWKVAWIKSDDEEIPEVIPRRRGAS